MKGDVLESHAPQHPVSFAYGVPDASLFPWDEIRDIHVRLLRSRNPSLVHYAAFRGDSRLREALCAVLAVRGIAASADELLVTSGSQQALDIIARALLRPGDVVLVESPTYPGAIGAFRQSLAQVVPVRLQGEGGDVAGLEQAWQRSYRSGKRIRVLYLVPHFNNPTGALMSAERRQVIGQWAHSRGVLIIEDDPYHWVGLQPPGADVGPPAMRAHDRHGGVVYVSTVSKILAPTLRVGWINASADLVDLFERVKIVTDLSSSALNQSVVDEAFRSGVISRLVPRVRESYRVKRDALVGALNDRLGDKVSCVLPMGGFYVWATLLNGVSQGAIVERARREGVEILGGQMFCVDETGHDKIRLSFSALSVEEVLAGTERLERAVRASAQ